MKLLNEIVMWITGMAMFIFFAKLTWWMLKEAERQKKQRGHE